MDNTQQFEFWNGPVGERWASRQERMDHHLQAIQEALMAFAAPERTEDVHRARVTAD